MLLESLRGERRDNLFVVVDEPPPVVATRAGR